MSSSSRIQAGQNTTTQPASRTPSGRDGSQKKSESAPSDEFEIDARIAAVQPFFQKWATKFLARVDEMMPLQKLADRSGATFQLEAVYGAGMPYVIGATTSVNREWAPGQTAPKIRSLNGVQAPLFYGNHVPGEGFEKAICFAPYFFYGKDNPMYSDRLQFDPPLGIALSVARKGGVTFGWFPKTFQVPGAPDGLEHGPGFFIAVLHPWMEKAFAPMFGMFDVVIGSGTRTMNKVRATVGGATDSLKDRVDATRDALQGIAARIKPAPKQDEATPSATAGAPDEGRQAW